MWFLFKILLKWRARKLDQFEFYQVKTKYGPVFISFEREPIGAIDKYVSLNKNR